MQGDAIAITAGHLQYRFESAAREQRYPYSQPPASRRYVYGADNCPNAKSFLAHFIRWSTFNDRYQPEHCEIVATIVRDIAEQNRASKR